MKSSLKKLRGFALHRQDPIDRRRDLTSSAAQLDELAKDIHDMRNCYDSLLSAAAATENSAYEFSESLREMGACLLEKTALSDDEESGRVLLMLGKVQFELQKLVDNYRGHIFQTITTPSESLLSELLTVEEMKRQCDEKRNVYEDMMATQREKRKSRAFKGETFSPEQLQTAHDEYDDEATLFVFRLKSLKQGQTRSLLTQAARHHAAQLNFFSKGLRSLEVVDPHVRSVTEDQRIDYQFSGLEDDADDGYDDNDDHESDINDESEMSFDYEQIDRRLEVSTSRKSMELDQVDLSLRQEATTEAAKENLDRGSVNLHTLSREPRAGSYSAPIFAEKRLDTNERTPKLQPLSSRKFHAYVLPTPLDPKSSKSVASINSAPRKHTSLIKTESFWHSSPLEPKEHEKHSRDVKLGGLNSFKSRPVLKESNINSASSRSILPPLAEGFSLRQLDPRSGDAKKIKRDAYSGPITSKAWSVPPVLSSNGPLRSMEPPQIQLLSRVPVFSASSPKVSQISSPPLISAPKITELHELPRPPIVSLITSKNTPLVGHSAPLARSSELSATKKTPLRTSHAVSSLPEPPPSVPRSFSIPSNGQRATALHVSKLLEFPRIKDKAEEAASPPLTPIFFGNTKPTSEVVVYAGRTEGSGD